MKIIRQLFTVLFLPLSLLPVIAVAHPGHEHEGIQSASHMLSVAEPYLISLAMAILVVSAVWLAKRI